MAWYYANQGQQAGPVDDAAFDNLVRQGVVRDDTLVWKDGMASWQAYSNVKPQSMAAEKTVVMKIPAAVATPTPAPPAATPQPSAMDTRFCSQCGRPTLATQLTMVNGAPTCPACAAVLRPAAAPTPAPAPQAYNPQPMGGGMGQPNQGMGGGQGMGAGMGAAAQGMGAAAAGWAQAPTVAINMGQMQQQPMGAYRYAGFWIRFVAFLIDLIIVGIVGTIITLPLAFLGIGSMAFTVNQNDPSAAMAALPAMIAAGGLVIVIRLALAVAYEAYFLSTRGATLGKMALGLKVVRTDGGPISLGLAIGRFFGKVLSGVILYIGYIMAGFDPQKRALHDRLSNTYVIYGK